MSRGQTSITGHLDGLRGAEIVGWAFGGDQPCRITAQDAKGNKVAFGYAALERPDLLCLGQGRCDFAFRIPIALNDQSRLIHVLADGVEVANSPLVIGSGQFDGFFEVRHGVVDGWVTERNARASPPIVTIQDQDGTVVFHSRLVGKSGASGDGQSPGRFAGKLDQRCFGAGERVLSALANGTKFAAVTCNLNLRGNVETLLADRCSGWLLSTDAPARPFDFEVIRDGQVVAIARCNIPRQDVQALFPGVQKCGFSCTLPPVSSGVMEFTTISLRFAGSDRELFDGPFVVAGRPAIIEAARQASRITFSLPRADLKPGVQVVLQAAIQDFLAKGRQSQTTLFRKSFPTTPQPRTSRRLSVIIPIYRGVDITRTCIESVLQCRSADRDRIILVHDHSPESEMAGMLHHYLREPNLFLLNNDSNLGFIRSVNRALSFCGSEDVLLLNSDTRLFAGALDRLWRVAHSAPDIGTVTAMSNNATIFSYPHYSLRRDALGDVSWQDLAAAALRLNGEISVDVPSGHGFCMLIKREVLDRLTNLDEGFGRGYGEENDLCARAADLGFRNVAAAGVLVEHRESISFLHEKADLIAQNLARLESRYPEYTPTVIEVERRDDLRVARWALDAERLRLASAAGRTFALVVSHRLGGGTSKAMIDIEQIVGYGQATKLGLSCRSDGYLELESADPLLHATFAPEDMRPLFDVLAAANIRLVVMHQVLGFPAGFIDPFKMLLRGTRSIFYAHDFYSFCPRVTMIDAMAQFCNQAPVDVCARCVTLGGAHASSRLGKISPAEHREIFGAFLGAFTHVVTPSASAARYLEAAFPGLRVEPLPHPGPAVAPLQTARTGTEQIVLFGALGIHKGSAKLREIAQQAQLTNPDLRFTVVGYTDMDEELSRLGNVTITGAYAAGDLAGIVEGVNGRMALFLSCWPETYSYTLSEAVSLGFYPLVPDIGAPAERVRESGFGAVFPFPINATQVLTLVERLKAENPAPRWQAPFSADQTRREASIRRTRALFGLPGTEPAAPDQRVTKAQRRSEEPKSMTARLAELQ